MYDIVNVGDFLREQLILWINRIERYFLFLFESFTK